jgi:hypothetical protein
LLSGLLALWAKEAETTEFCHNNAARTANGAFHFFIVAPLVDMLVLLLIILRD